MLSKIPVILDKLCINCFSSVNVKWLFSGTDSLTTGVLLTSTVNYGSAVNVVTLLRTACTGCSFCEIVVLVRQSPTVYSVVNPVLHI